MNKKNGLVYFPFDVDFFQDEKIQFISARFGVKGEAITIRLLCKIFRQGYFSNWDEDIALLFAKGVVDGGQDSCVKDVVCELLKRGFFDKSIFERFMILTSKGIQRRYVEASVRRNSVDMISEFLLIDVKNVKNVNVINLNDTKTTQNVYGLNENADILKQSKVKESKVNINKTPLPPSRGNSTKTKLRAIWESYQFQEELAKALESWIKYKTEKGQAYKPQGLNSLLSQMACNSNKFGVTAVIELISDCMANNWQGIIWDRLKNNKATELKGSEVKKRRFDNYESRTVDLTKLEQIEIEERKRLLSKFHTNDD